MSHKVHSFNFTSLVSERWSSFPDPEKLKKQIAVAVLAHSELSNVALGLYAPPKEIREVRVTAAVFDQVKCMWHGHRIQGHKSPPPIPLKIFVFGFGQDAINVELHRVLTRLCRFFVTHLHRAKVLFDHTQSGDGWVKVQ